MRFLILSFYVLQCVNLFSQVEIYRNQQDTTVSVNTEDTAYYPPKFPLNNGDFIQYLNQEFNFNQIGNFISINGLNYRFSFVIDKKGKVEDFKTYSVANTDINMEFDRIINRMPNWTPAKQGSKNLKTTMNYDLNFEFHAATETFIIKKNNLYIDNTPSHKALKWFIVAGALMVFVGLLVLKG